MRLVQPLLAGGPRTYEIAEMMAMVLAELGEYSDAISWQHEAISIAGRAGRQDVAKRMTATLSEYERRHPCRTPWRRDDTPSIH
jgi:hypothetical protein